MHRERFMSPGIVLYPANYESPSRTVLQAEGSREIDDRLPLLYADMTRARVAGSTSPLFRLPHILRFRNPREHRMASRKKSK